MAVVKDHGALAFSALKIRLIRKLVTKPRWWWDRYRPYPIRQRVFQLPPLAVAEEADCTLAVLTTPQSIANAAWTAYTFLRELGACVRLSLVLDGRWPAAGAARLRQLFPRVELLETAALVAQLASACPMVNELAKYHAMGRKLGAILSLQRGGHLLYCDDDVLALSEIPELKSEILRGSPRGLYMQDQGLQLQHEPSLMRVVRELRLPLAETINVGVLLIPRNSLDLEVAGRLLGRAGRIDTWFPDTVVLSVLMALQNASPLPPAEYLVSTQGQFWFEGTVDYSAVRVRHFVGPVRHLMYSEGMPLSLHRLNLTRSHGPATTIPTVGSTDKRNK